MGAWLLAGLLTRRLARAGAVASRLATGDLDARVRAGGSDEVAALGDQLDTMADRVQASIEQHRRFVSDTAHELRTPTAALLAQATALESPLTRDAAAAEVVPQLRRLSGLTEDLLLLSRFDAGRETLRTRPVDVGALVRGVVSDIAPADTVTVTADTGEAEIDPARVGVVVRNLVANALQHGQAPVGVRVGLDQDTVRIEVDDAGEGVPEELRGSLFDRFVRGDQSRHSDSDSPSTGLGLALARENARPHGGDVTLDADGRRFTAVLRAGSSAAPDTLASPGRRHRSGASAIGLAFCLSAAMAIGAASMPPWTASWEPFGLQLQGGVRTWLLPAVAVFAVCTVLLLGAARLGGRLAGPWGRALLPLIVIAALAVLGFAMDNSLPWWLAGGALVWWAATWLPALRRRSRT